MGLSPGKRTKILWSFNFCLKLKILLLACLKLLMRSRNSCPFVSITRHKSLSSIRGKGNVWSYSWRLCSVISFQSSQVLEMWLSRTGWGTEGQEGRWQMAQSGRRAWTQRKEWKERTLEWQGVEEWRFCRRSMRSEGEKGIRELNYRKWGTRL